MRASVRFAFHFESQVHRFRESPSVQALRRGGLKGFCWVYSSTRRDDDQRPIAGSSCGSPAMYTISHVGLRDFWRSGFRAVWYSWERSFAEKAAGRGASGRSTRSSPGCLSPQGCFFAIQTGLWFPFHSDHKGFSPKNSRPRIEGGDPSSPYASP